MKISNFEIGEIITRNLPTVELYHIYSEFTDSEINSNLDSKIIVGKNYDLLINEVCAIPLYFNGIRNNFIYLEVCEKREDKDFKYFFPYQKPYIEGWNYYSKEGNEIPNEEITPLFLKSYNIKEEKTNKNINEFNSMSKNEQYLLIKFYKENDMFEELAYLKSKNWI